MRSSSASFVNLKHEPPLNESANSYSKQLVDWMLATERSDRAFVGFRNVSKS